MATNYPGSVDDFGVPSLPEETPLSSAGDSTRDHTQLHKDEGDAIEALQANAALKSHDHSGTDSIGHGTKLTQANTHQSADTDGATTALHHTIGSGANQAAAGNHVHDYSVITNTPFRRCTSSTRPSSPSLGLIIYETDTHRMRVWDQYPGDPDPSWRYLLGPLPNVRLRQTAAQQLNASGTILEWREELEDGFDMFNSGISLTNITCKEAGLYQVTVAVQWDPQHVPDVAHVIVVVNGVETTVRQQQYLRGNVFQPGFSQTITATGPLRLALNDVVTVKVKYTAGGGLLGFIFSFFDSASKVNSRFDLAFVGP